MVDDLNGLDELSHEGGAADVTSRRWRARRRGDERAEEPFAFLEQTAVPLGCLNLPYDRLRFEGSKADRGMSCAGRNVERRRLADDAVLFGRGLHIMLVSP